MSQIYDSSEITYLSHTGNLPTGTYIEIIPTGSYTTAFAKLSSGMTNSNFVIKKTFTATITPFTLFVKFT